MCKGTKQGVGADHDTQTDQSSRCRSSLILRLRWIPLLWLCLAFSVTAQAADQRFALLLDTDNNTATGCPVAAPSGTVAGIDQVLTTVVTTTNTGATISRIERQLCTGGSLGAANTLNPGGWSAGIGNGASGTAAIETAIALGLLPSSGAMRVTPMSMNSAGGQDVTAAFLIPLGATTDPVQAPLSQLALALLAAALIALAFWWRRRFPAQFNAAISLCLVAVSTLVWAAGVMLDGNTADWYGVSPAVTSPQSGPVDADMLAVYWQKDSTNLYFRIDADVRPDGASNAAITVGAGANQDIVLPAGANLQGSATRTPSGPVLSLLWTKNSGPGNVSFSAPTQLETIATFSQAGNYVLQLSATDGTISNSATMTVTVADAPVSPSIAVSAGGDQNIALPASATLAGSATLSPASASTITYGWSYLSGPAAAVMFADSTQPGTAVTFDQPGAYTLRLTATANSLSNHADVTIHVVDGAPTLAAIADRQLALGATMSLVLAGSSPNVAETLTYSLDTAPTGGSLQPTPKIVWTPANAQLGANRFTARLTDSHGRSDTKSFTVTVVHDDRAPVFDAQADETTTRGTTFARALHATDPDGDSLAYALDSGPSGMTLSGAQLSWPTASIAPGRYPVVVRATDPAGLYDVKRFFVVVTDAAAPVAHDDTYQVHVGETLNVSAPGVLANDGNPMSATLTATKVSDPDKGALNSFNADGSFSFTAPAVVGSPLAPTVKWKTGAAFWSGASANVIVIPLPGRSAPAIIAPFNPTANATGLSALDGATGAVLWTTENYLPAPYDSCFVSVAGGLSYLAAGDIDDSGHPAVVLPIVCNGELSYRGGGTRMAALDAATGAVKWLTVPLGFQITNSPNYFSMTDYTTPVIARLKPGQTPSVLFQKIASGYLDNPETQRACDQFQANSGLSACTGVIALDGSNGNVRQKWIAPADGIVAAYANDGAAPIVANIPGSCTPCLLASGAVWDADGNLISNVVGVGGFISVALAKIDDGATAIIRHETANGGYLTARRADGTLIWKAPIGVSSFNGKISVGDLDGDGEPDIVVSVAATLYAYDAHGTLRWVRRFVDSANNAILVDGNRQAIFDLDGDGIAEVIVETGQGFDFLNGKDGSVESAFTFAAIFGNDGGYHDNAGANSPVVADIDGSGHASVLFAVPTAVYGGSPWIVAFGADNWRDARGVFGEYSYHVSDINADGSIPQIQSDNFALARTNVFGNQPQVTTPVDPRTHTQTSFTYTAGADGLTSAPATVTIDILPANRPPVFDSVPPTRYLSGQDLAGIYHPHAFDPDVGDTITYRMVLASGNNVGGAQIDPNTGAFVAGRATLFADDQTFTIAATDSQGASTFQSFTLKQSAGSAALPDVTGQTQADATAALTNAGFAVDNVIYQFDAATEGQVLAQAPVGGTTVILGEEVSLTVSKGPQPVAVPFIVGEDKTVADTQLTAIGFTPAPIYVFSDTVPFGVVMSQSPAAGSLVSPSPAHPISFVASAGNGLQVRVDRSIAAANQTIAITPLAFDVNGNPVAVPPLSYSIIAALTPYAGTLPTVSGTTITLSADTRGAFTLIATDVPNGRIATAAFSVVPPATGDGSTNGESFANLAATLDAIYALREPLVAARAAHDTVQMTALLKQMVTTWRTLDLDDLRISVPLAPEGGFAPSLDDMANLYHETSTSNDLLVQGVLTDAVGDIEAFESALKTDGTTYAELNALADNFAVRAARLNGLTVSRYGAILNNPQYIKLMSHDIPAFYDALMEQIAQTTGMPVRAPQFPGAQRAGGAKPSMRIGGGAQVQTTLAELAVTEAVDMVLDKIMSEASQTYANAKQFAGAIMQQAAWSAAAISVVSELKAFSLGQDIYEVAAGASLSFREFKSPWSFIEVPGGLSEPKLVSVMVVGPDTVNAAGGAITDLFQKLKAGFSHGLDPQNNPQRFRNIDDAKKAFSALFAKLKAVGQAVTNLQDVIANAYQTPGGIARGCIFTSDRSCSQLTFDEGIKTVYSYSPPQGYSTLSGLPVPIIFIVQDQLNGTMYFGSPAFLPTPKP